MGSISYCSFRGLLVSGLSFNRNSKDVKPEQPHLARDGSSSQNAW